MLIFYFILFFYRKFIDAELAIMFADIYHVKKFDTRFI